VVHSKDLLKHTWNEHPDYESLSKAAVKIDQIAGHLNEMKRQAETFAQLLDIQSSLIGKNIPVSYLSLSTQSILFSLTLLLLLFLVLPCDLYINCRQLLTAMDGD
jgi:hypothetical protein